VSERSVEHATIAIEREFDASPSRVFAAWANPGARRRWDVPQPDWELVEHQHDFRVGGCDVVQFGPPGELVYRGETRYENIVSDSRIVSTYTIAEDDKPMSVSVLTVELLAAGKGTRMILTEQAVFLDGNDSPAARHEGLSEMLDKLEAWLRQPPDDLADRAAPVQQT
jgi:uncharacterized protein YndB with AHSA1/START domain